MDMKIQKDTKFVLSFTEEEILKLQLYLSHSELCCDVSENTYYENHQIDDFVVETYNDIQRLLEDKLVD